MVIEHAERMGLAQLHQLRGRVGRGAAEKRVRPPVCRALERTRQSTAESDLRIHRRLRNRPPRPQHPRPRRILGARQSGIPMLRFANLEEDLHLLEQAREIAPMLIEQNPEIVEAHLARWLASREGYLGV